MSHAEPRIAIPLGSGIDHRSAPRFDVQMPVQLAGAAGVTHDLSTSGLCFESPRAYVPGERVAIVIEYLLDGHNYPLRCQAQVVRCQLQGTRYLVGARLLSPMAEGPYDALS
jgi:hypothetical protein